MSASKSQAIRDAVAEAMQDATISEQAEIVNALLTAAGMCIAISARGDAKTIDMLVEGSNIHLLEQATYFQKFGRAMAILPETYLRRKAEEKKDE